MLLFVGVASAQGLPCAALLEALPATRFNDLTSFEATFTFRENDSTITIRRVEDVTQQRSYYEVTEGSGETTIARYESDTGTVESNRQTEVAPPEKENEMLGFFDVFLSQKIFSEAELLSCDGQQTLETPEGTLEGKTITVIIEDDEGQLFFDTNGHVIGWKSQRDSGVFQNEYADDLLVKSVFNIYVKPEETASVSTATLERIMTFELVNYNQSIDGALFGGDLECEGLLETFKNQPEFTSLETTTTYPEDADSFDYKVVDFTGQRVYWEITIGGTKSVFRLVDGKVTGTTESNETIEVPEGIRLSLEATFSSAASFRDIAEKAVVLSCDGEQSYSDASGEIVRGQQITAADKTNAESESAKLLFDDAGNFIGNYIDRPEDSQDYLLITSDIKKDEGGVVVEVTNATYLQKGDSFELLNKTTTKTLSYNQPVDEALFEP